MEAVFRPKIFRTFSDDFRPVPVETQRKLTGIHRKKSGQFPAGILLPFPRNSGVFLQDPVTFPPLYGGIRSFPEAGIIDLGCYCESIFYRSLLLIVLNKRINCIQEEFDGNIKLTYTPSTKHPQDSLLFMINQLTLYQNIDLVEWILEIDDTCLAEIFKKK
jgi:hypothetical protein